MNDLRTYRKCVRIVICRGNKILLGERRYSDGSLMYYEFPGGGIENNDSLIETVKKESLEEVGCEVTNVSCLDLYYIYDISYTNPSRAKKYKGGEDVWYTCDFVKHDHSIHGKEGDALPHRWVEINEAIDLLRKGPASKYNQARLEALKKVKDLMLNKGSKLFEAQTKKPKLSDW